MTNGPNIPTNRPMAQDGYRPQATPEILHKGYKPNPQGGYVGPTQSAPSNPPSGGSSGRPATGSGGKSDK